MAQAVVLQHRGDRNLGLALAGAFAFILGLVLIAKSPSFGAVLFLGGVIAFAVGIKPRTTPCPQCRARISKKAMTCPQCRTPNPWGA